MTKRNLNRIMNNPAAVNRMNEIREAESKTYLILGRFIAEERKRLGLTLSSLEELSGVGAGFINDIEHGRGNPTWKTLSALSSAFNRNIVGLLAECHIRYLQDKIDAKKMRE